MNSLQVVIGRLEELFTIFNDRYYGGQLVKPVITVSPDVTTGAYGWCTSWKAWKPTDGGDTEGYYEINMCAEHLARPFVETCGTLLHEMVHLWNLQHDVKDTSRGGTYHNKKFKIEAEQRGLIIDKSEKYGWTITTLNEDAKAFIATMDDQGFKIHRTKMVKMESTSNAKKSSSRKYVCPQCELIVRATKEVNLLCGECSSEDNLVKMELEEDGE